MCSLCVQASLAFPHDNVRFNCCLCAGVVVFQRPRPSAEVLSDYSADVEAVLALVEKTTHLIRKEYMVHGVAPPSFVR